MKGNSIEKLKQFFSENAEVALGFSGGADSSYLLYAASKYAKKIGAYFIKTAFQPQFELEDAMRLAKGLGVEVTVLETDILANGAVAVNPSDRCYHCKTALFTLLKSTATRDGYKVLIDGTNASDEADDRPGMRALKELSVRSPLRECEITKSEIRELSREAGLFTWDKPAYACLATRIPTDKTITTGLLQRIEAAEDKLFAMGFTDFRVRVYEKAARLQLPDSQMKKAIEQWREINKNLCEYFELVLLDLGGR